MPQNVNRREFLSAAGAAGLAATALGASPPKPVGARRPVVVASGNGLRAVEKAMELIQAGADPLDAAIEGVAIVEADPTDHSVGFGGIPNEEGVVELDAAVMHGPSHGGGAVAALRNIMHPAAVARAVMKRTDHCLLVGEGALKFAHAHGFPEVNLLTDEARAIWLHWKETNGKESDWIAPPDSELDPAVRRFFGIREPGTIHCSALDTHGDLGCVTTTSGLYYKIPGRVGDSPILGAGLFLDNEVGSAGSTGRGEANLLNLSSHAIVEGLRRGSHQGRFDRGVPPDRGDQPQPQAPRRPGPAELPGQVLLRDEGRAIRRRQPLRRFEDGRPRRRLRPPRRVRPALRRPAAPLTSRPSRGGCRWRPGRLRPSRRGRGGRARRSVRRSGSRSPRASRPPSRRGSGRARSSCPWRPS